MECEHRFVRAGVVYELSEWPYAGSAAREVTYDEHYFCEKCLEHRYERLPTKHDSYQPVRFDAVPRQGSKP